MSSQASAPTRLTLVYDPLCGWCYGAVPTIRRLAQEPALSIELVPAGLFAGPGARAMDDHFARHAWSNDQRIAQLTGQPFSVRYRERVLADRCTPLDSGPAILALTAVHQTAPERELAALEAIQAARYVDGRNVTDDAVLVELLRGMALDTAATRVERRSPELLAATAARTTTGRDLLRAIGAVPALLVHKGRGLRVIPSELLYGRFDDLIHHLGAAAPELTTRH